MLQTVPVPVVLRCLARPRCGHVALLVGLALSLSVANRGQAATTWTVCASGCDYTSLKSAIAAPTTLDGDTLAIAAGTYTGAASTIVQAAATPNTASKRVFVIPSDVTVTLQDLMVRNGRTTGFGGGLSNLGTLTLMNSTVSGNSAFSGGGLFNHQHARLTLTNSTVNGNSAGGGGGLFNRGMLMLTNSTVSGNSAVQGGGVDNERGSLTLTNSTVSGNSAGGGGGGFVNGGSLMLTNSTVSRNSTRSGDGGGVYNGGSLMLTNSTVSGNSALDGSGGGVYNFGGLDLTASLVANNVANTHGMGDCGEHWWGSTTSHGSNLDSDGSCQLTAATDQPGVDPLLGPLQDNGGPTFTYTIGLGTLVMLSRGEENTCHGVL
jgi:hypothetical protein